ncbi:MAG: CBS domain-containing protein [Planctomycetes bacterium]|nr:CBS domain-containing protein [Planctomycetota bacterium]
MKIRELMSSYVHTCRPQDSLETAARKMWEHDCGALPVVDADGRVGAVITDRDICMAAGMSGSALAELRVADSMSRQLVTCRGDDEVYTALKAMAEHQLHRLPVVDEHDRLCGILSLNDLAVVGEMRSRIGRGALKVLAAVSRHRAKVPATVATVPPALAAMSE